jgi:serine acetyltransferase
MAGISAVPMRWRRRPALRRLRVFASTAEFCYGRTMGATLQALRGDAARYDVKIGPPWYKHEGFWIGATYRVGVWAQSLPFALRLPTAALYRIVNKVWWRTILNVNISPEARIGPGLYLIHPRNIFIPPTEIGDNFTIFQEATIGANGDPPRYPKIGANVVVFVGARVLGGIVVGDGSKIGANCVVTTDVRAGSVVVPAANRVVPPAVAAVFGIKDSISD